VGDLFGDGDDGSAMPAETPAQAADYGHAIFYDFATRLLSGRGGLHWPRRGGSQLNSSTIRPSAPGRCAIRAGAGPTLRPPAVADGGVTHHERLENMLLADRDAMLRVLHPVIVNSGPTTTEFIVSLIIVGILGPSLGVLAARWADRRRFAHERKLKASDDLIARIDDVAESLDRLCEACSIVRITAALQGPESVGTLKAISDAEHAHLRTRAVSSRLAMRPHADQTLLESALAAATCMNGGIENVRNANMARQAAVKAAGQAIVMAAYDDDRVESLLNSGLKHIEEFKARARAAIGMLLDEPS